ncbi:pseudouridylate synthase 3 [Periconia macrospinosa]|uniref:Pseudouridylate synthase 3 n=1 Tax=Periconia macrospinosa TaxID=97972 RepID=A0A2V1DJJ0_9PLEO|nr:pseudouridylate synthase 3 [Periconia macrospinosa]
MPKDVKYEEWSQEQLIAKINELEKKLTAIHTPGTVDTTEGNTSTDQVPYRKPPKQTRKVFDASKYSSRYIALKFAYLGQNYQGFEHHANNKTPLPTIEEELWKALMKTRLINPTKREGQEDEYARVDREINVKGERQGVDVNWEGCEYSKCGRTDKGVSAFGQVIGIRVRSNRPLPKPKTASPPPETADVGHGEEVESADPQDYAPLPSDSETEEPFDDIADELPYINMLNRILPPAIRVYAWCPNPPPNFSARFSCKERRYKYFFTNPCFVPPPGSSGLHPTLASSGRGEEGKTTTATTMRDGWLDIAKMQEACKHLVGLHDFRNFCKIDPSKQLTNFQRRIFHAEIDEVSPLSLPSFLAHTNIAPTPTPPTAALDPHHQQPKLYAFTVHGSAFLWHQVRSLVGILFLVGQGLEAPSIVPTLLDIAANPTRPMYQMASDAPLVLWDCIFPHADEVQSTDVRASGYEDRLEWIYAGDSNDDADDGVLGKGKWGRMGVMDDVWEVWRGHKIDETISGLLLDRLAGLGKGTLDAEAFAARSPVDDEAVSKSVTDRLFEGGDTARYMGPYVPLMKRPRQDPVEVINKKYAVRKGLDVKQSPPADDEE